MKYLRESIGPFCFVTALCGVYFLFFINIGLMFELVVPVVHDLSGSLFAGCVILLALVAATLTYVVKASAGKVSWSLIAGTVLGLVYFAMFAWLISEGLVAGVDNVEGLIAVAGASISAFCGISLTTACALMLVDRLRDEAQPKSVASYEPGFSMMQ